MEALAGKVKFQPRMCSLSSCYCRLKLSQLMPTVHILPKQGNQAKANIEPIVFWVTPLYQLTPVSCRQLVGWVSRLLHQVLPHKFSHPLSPRYTSSAVRRKKRVGKTAGREHPLQIQTHGHGAGMCTPCSHTNTPLPTYTSVACAHANAHFSSVPASPCRFIPIACQEYKCKKGSHCWNGQVQHLT